MKNKAAVDNNIACLIHVMHALGVIKDRSLTFDAGGKLTWWVPS